MPSRSALTLCIPLLTLTACGARTELAGEPIPPPSNPDDANTTPTTCPFTTLTVLAKSTQHNVDIRLDPQNVYWNDGAHINRVPKAGGPITQVATGAIDVGNFDVTSTTTYYATHGSGVLMQAGASTGVLAVLLGPVERVAVADAVYIVAPSDSEALYRVSFQGGPLSVVAPLGIATPKTSLPSEFPQGVYGLVVRNDVAYLAMVGWSPNPSLIAAVDIATGSLTALSEAPLSLPVTSLAADDQFVYFAEYIAQKAAPSIRRVPITGGTADPIVPTPTYCTSCILPTPLAVDATNVYFPSDEFGTTLKAWSKTSSSETTVAPASTTGASVSGIATDGTCVYWVATSDENVYAAPR